MIKKAKKNIYFHVGPIVGSNPWQIQRSRMGTGTLPCPQQPLAHKTKKKKKVWGPLVGPQDLQAVRCTWPAPCPTSRGIARIALCMSRRSRRTVIWSGALPAAHGPQPGILERPLLLRPSSLALVAGAGAETKKKFFYY